MFPLSLQAVRRLAALWVYSGSLLLTPVLRSQHVLAAECDGKSAVVQRLQGHPPYVEIEGKSISCASVRFALLPGNAYSPVTVKMEHRRFQKGSRAISDDGPARVQLRKAGRFVLTGDLWSPEALDNVVLVLEFTPDRNGSSIFAENIGHLDANVSRHVNIDEVTASPLTRIGLKRLHVFVNGVEARLEDDGAHRPSRDKPALVPEQPNRTATAVPTPAEVSEESAR